MPQEEPVHPNIETSTPGSYWAIDPEVTFLNHGSFGSCPRPVLEFQQQLRARLEKQPVQFFVRDLEPMLDDARARLAAFLGADPDNLVFVPNATTGVNTVLRSLDWKPGDELIVTDHEYNACRNALDYVAQRGGARVVPVTIPFPVRSEDEIADRILAAVTPRTRLALFDHVTSQTGIIFPVERLIAGLKERGVETLIDGAHAPGMVPLNLAHLTPTYYTGNCHKWLCAPKGAGFLVVDPVRQPSIRPLTISHGANSTRSDRSRFQIEFGWTGTCDPTAYLSVPEAIRLLESQVGGWTEIMGRNHELALGAREILCQALDVEPPSPDHLIGSLASIPLPDGSSEPSRSPLYADPLQDQLLSQFRIEVPVIPWPHPPKRLLRVSAQLYNSPPQYHRLAQALQKLLT